MASFKYRRRSEQDMEKQAAKTGNFPSFLKSEFREWRPKKGDNWIRIFPPTWGLDDKEGKHYALEVHVHYGIGPEKASVLCLAKHPHPKTGDNRCPICVAQRKAERDGDQELAKELRSARRALAWIKDKDNKDADGPQPWAMPSSFDEQVAKISYDKRTGESYYVDDPEEGYDVMFEKEGEGLTTKYKGHKLGRRANSIPKKDLDFVLDNPLPDILLHRTEEEVQALFDGSVPEDDERPRKKRRVEEEDEEEERPRKRRAVEEDEEEERPRKRSSRDEEEEEEEERPRKRRARDEEEEEEEERPRKRRAVEEDEEEERPRKRRAVEEEEEEEERPRRKPRVRDEEEEEEEPPPRKKAGGKPTMRRDEEEEEEEPPPRKASVKPKPRSRDDVDEDEIPSKGRRNRDDDEEESSSAAARVARLKAKHAR